MEKRDKLAVFDIDGTFYRDSLNIEVIDRLAEAGLIPSERMEGLNKLRQAWKNRDGTYTDYIALLVRLMEDGLLNGIPDVDYRTIADKVVDDLGDRVYVFPRELHCALQNAGYATVALSGSPEYAVKRFAERWRFSDIVATRFGVDADGCLISQKSHIDVPAERKGEEFKRLCARDGADPYKTVAIGDTIGDAAMLQEAEFPIAFNPDQRLDGLAWSKSWPVVVERKDTVILVRRDRRCSLETMLPREVALELRTRLTAYGITVRP